MFKGKHCLITGGSQGLGKALAIQLAQEGADVSILARGAPKLKAAAAEIQSVLCKERKVSWHQANVTEPESLVQAMLAAEKAMDGRAPEIVFACAGAALPGLFVEQKLSEFKDGVNLNYLGTVYTLRTAVDRMLFHGLKGGHLVIVSSTAGLMGLPGYSQYAPTKFALRGLAECLRAELLPHEIHTHIYFASTISSEGLEAENRRKPAITRYLEDGETSDCTPEARARVLLDGLRRGRFMITSDWTTDLIRASALGVSPANFWPKDLILLILGWLFLPIWRWWADYQTVRLAKK